MKKLIIIVFVFLGLPSMYAQEIDSYKYVLLPNEYGFLREPNQYQLNELTKFLFLKAGFDAYLEDEELPGDLKTNPCNALSADVDREKGLFVTKLVVILKNCKNQTVYTSEIGSSREKDFKTAHHEALRDAFRSIEALNYSYAPGTAVPVQESAGNFQEAKEVGEVKASTPEEKLRARAPETVPEVNRHEVINHKMLFSLDNATYYLIKSEFGFELFQHEISKPVASLFATGLKDIYLYSSSKLCGVASLEEEGNLVVEVVPDGKEVVEVRQYNRIHQ